MIKKSIFLFAFCASPLLPAFSRFSYGLIFTLAFCVSFLALLGIRKLILLSSLKKEYAPVIEILGLVLCTALYAGLVKLILPIEVFALDFFIYLVPFVYFLFDALSFKYNGGDGSALTAALTAVAFPPVLSLFRELLYFGTITFPAIGGAYSLYLFPSNVLEFTRFWGSFPGTLIALGLLFWLINALSSGEGASRPKSPLSSAKDSKPK